MRLDRFAQEVASKLQLKLFMSNRYVYAQIVRHSDGNVVASASTIESALRQGLPGSGVDKGACAKVGDVLAQRALAVGIQGVEWKRKVGQRYHGRIAALLTSMQESGVKLV